MSSSEETKKQVFVVWAPDYTDDEAFNRRLAVRPQHLAGHEANVKSGYLTSL
jgi:hypothetical protein